MVYKSEQGKTLVREIVSKIYKTKSPYSYKEININTSFGNTHIINYGNYNNPPIIFLHGSTSNSSTWFGSLKYFINEYSIYLIDIPGEPGLSVSKRLSLNSQEPSLWINEILDKLNITKANLIGMSLGGWFSLNFAINYPEKVKSISLLTTSGIVKPRISFIFKALFFMLLGRLGQKLLNNSIYFKTQQITDEEYIKYQRLTYKHYNPLVDPIPIFTDDELKKITSPILYFGGDHDCLLKSEKTGERIMENIKMSQVNILKDTGHVIINKFSDIKEFIYKQYKKEIE